MDPSGTASVNCRIKVSAVASAFVFDESDGNFTIAVPPPASIAVTSPNGTEQLEVGQPCTITWTSQNVIGNVNIKLNRTYPSGTWESLFTNIANDGSEVWTVAGAVGGNCRLRIETTNITTIYDLSNANFAITPEGGGEMTLFSDSLNGSFNTALYLRGDSNSNNGLDYWANKTRKPHTGAMSCYCAGYGSPAHPPYDNYMSAYFHVNANAPLNVAGFSNVVYSFWIWYATQSGVDKVKAQYANGSSAWIDLPNTNWSGNSGGWVQKTYALEGFTDFRFRFLFTSNGSVTAEGVYIDDIVITGTAGSGPMSLPESPQVIDLSPGWEISTDLASTSEKSLLPVQSELSDGAYPNPFNSSTTIRYHLAEAMEVNLTVYNVLGHRVAELVNGFRASGDHEVTFDGSNLASGVYIYRFSAGEVKSLKKIILLK